MLSRGKKLVILACTQLENNNEEGISSEQFIANTLPVSTTHNLSATDNSQAFDVICSNLNDENSSSDLEAENIIEDDDDSIRDPNYVTPDKSTSSSSKSDDSNDDSIIRNPSYAAPDVNTLLKDNITGEPEQTLTRWKKSDPSTWKYNVAKKRRSLGMTYEIKKKQRPAKEPETVNCEKCRFKCQENFSNEDRQLLCRTYWKLGDFKRQKDFILSNVTCSAPERRRIRTGNRPARQNAKQYHFEKQTNKCRVCQNFFLKTLNISNDVILNAFRYKGDAGTYEGEDKRGRSEPGNKTKPEIIADVKNHIESFPTMESHYSRKFTKRQYLDSKLSISKMYALYKEKCQQENKQCVKFITYKRIFGNNYNLSFFKPKKDLCQICDRYTKAKGAEKQQLEENYLRHQKRKTDCYAAKILDKQRAINEESFISVTFDLQSVLQIPCSDVSPMYYSRKICVYNLTVYESAPPNDAYCFCWTELNGKRGSSEIGTCLFKYLKCLPQSITEIVLWSDTCGGQNRNMHVAALLLYLVQTTHIQVIEHKFLESGHSYMEADSMHSAIERCKKYVPVYTMQDWLNIFRLARSNRCRNKKSSPYITKELKYRKFYDLKKLSNNIIKNKSKDEDGQTVNWLLIKALKYSKQNPGTIRYKYEHTSDYKSINICGKGRPSALPKQLSRLYSTLLPISIKKKKDLQKLCRSLAIPEEFHGWYNGLPSSNAAKDLVTEPSIEDSGSEEYDSDNEPLSTLLPSCCKTN